MYQTSVDKESVATIAEYTNHVNLYFFSGARLSSNLLQGTGKEMRHIKFQSFVEIDEREFTKLLKRAENLARTKKNRGLSYQQALTR